MPRAIWTGSIGFGMAHIPVKLFSAVSEHDVKFRRWDPITQEFPQQIYKAVDGTERRLADLTRVFELAPTEFLEITDDDLNSVRPVTRRHMQIEEFVGLDSVDTIYFDKSYFLAPGVNGERAYSLFLQALEDEGVVACVKVLMRSKEHSALIHVLNHQLMLTTLYYDDEITSNGVYPADVPVSEVRMARAIVRDMTNVQGFSNHYRRDDHYERINNMIWNKFDGNEPFVEPEVPATPREDFQDLLAREIAERGLTVDTGPVVGGRR